MKKVFFRFFLSALVIISIQSCEDEIEIPNTIPLVSFPTATTSVTAGEAQDLVVNISDGANGSLASGTITLSNGTTEIASNTQTLSGESGTLTLSAAETGIANLSAGSYTLTVSVSDSQGETATATTDIALACEPLAACTVAGMTSVVIVVPEFTTDLDGFDQIGMVGSLTDWGGRADIQFTQITSNCFCAAVDIPEGAEYKFRLNSDWTFVEKDGECAEVANRTESGSDGLLSISIADWRNSDRFGGNCPD